ncbi:MAG: hypothetical protein P8Y93_15030 [Acidobacteriota bacterium]
MLRSLQAALFVVDDRSDPAWGLPPPPVEAFPEGAPIIVGGTHR